MTLEQALDDLQTVLDDAYAQDPSVRHDPLFIAVKSWLTKVQAVLDEMEDAETEGAFQKWEAGNALDHSGCPSDGPCLVESHYR